MSLPILWTDRDYAAKARRKAMRWNPETNQREPVLDDRGAPAFERVPQTGREGVVREVGDIKNTKPMATPRSIDMLRDDGNEVAMVIRNAAAAGFGDNGSDTSFMRYQLAKAKRAGWLPVGCCPLDLVARRERNALQLDDLSLRAAAKSGDTGCRPHEVGVSKPPCKHYRAEMAARLNRRATDDKAAELRQKSDAARTTDALVDFVAKMAPAAAPTPAADQEFAPTRKGPNK